MKAATTRTTHNGDEDVSTLLDGFSFQPSDPRGLRPLSVPLVQSQENDMRFGPLGITFVGTAQELREVLRALLALGPDDVTLLELCAAKARKPPRNT